MGRATRLVAAGWIGEARFLRGGHPASERQNDALTVRAINPCRGTDPSTAGRIGLLKRALRTRPEIAGCTVYLTAAGFFGCETTHGWNARGVSWRLIATAE